jgi:sigma-B regulation protein RsbU (phosphoserine phosphatase)
MTIAARANRLIDRVNDAASDVYSRLRLAAEDVLDSSPIDSALNVVAGAIGATRDVEELTLRIAQLETEIKMLHQRDRLLSRHMTKFDEEQRLAARIQQDFLPKTMPAVGNIRFSAIFKPAHYVSGDLYDIRRLDEQHVGVYLADAVGHGTPAALLTMFMRNALLTKRIHANGYELVEPSETIATLNTSLRCQDLNHASFATAIYARINCSTGDLCFAKGGHPNPVRLRPDGSLEELTSDGSLLGVFDEPDWKDSHAKLEPGDRLFFYSDGIEVAFADAEKPSPDRWKRELSALAGASTATILQTFADAVDAIDTSLLPKDDLTVVVAEVG